LSGTAVVVATTLLMSGVAVSAQAAPLPFQAAAPSAVSSAPDLVSAQMAARAQGSRVQVDALTSETSLTWANPDGTLTADIASEPVRVHRPDGSWVPVDSTLQVAGGVVSPVASVLPVALSAGGSGDFAKVTGVDRHGRALRLGLGAGASLPVPVLAGNTATYRDVLPSTDLLVRVMPQVVSHAFVVRSPVGVRPSYRLPLDLQGLTVRTTAGGGVEAVDADGTRVFAAPAPMMWDASVDPDSGLSGHTGKVSVSVDTSTGTPALVLTPDLTFLADPGTVFPVTIDPSFSGEVYTDTWVESQTYTTSQPGSAELRVGTFDSGATKARSFLSFTTTALNYKHITGASLRLRNWWAQACTGSQVNVYQVTAAWDTNTLTWANQPAVTATGTGYSSEAHGYSSACPEQSIYYQIDSIVQAWADTPSSNHGLRVNGATETANASWRRYRSANYISGADVSAPHLVVNYDSYPTIGTPTTSPATLCVTGANRPFIATAQPTLSTVVSDEDGGAVREKVDVLTTGGTPLLTAQYSDAVTVLPAGSTTSWTVPAGLLSDGGSYQWKARGWDGALDSKSYSATCEFTVDITAPSATSVSSAQFPANVWKNGVGSGTFSFAATDAHFDHYVYGLDAAASTPLAPGVSSVTINPMPGGWHHLYVQGVDKAGNLGPVADYAFGSGSAVVSPAEGAITQGTVDLIGTTAPGATKVTFYWRRLNGDAWAQLPVANVTPGSGSPAFSGWPYTFAALSGDGAKSPKLSWNVAGTAPNLIGPLQVGVCFGDTTSCPVSPGTTLPTGGNASATPTNLTLDRDALSVAGTTNLGPVTVNLLTGNAQLSASDVSVPGSAGTSLSVARTLNTATVTSTPGNAALGAGNYKATAVFGPGWTASLPVDSAGSSWVGLVDTGSVLTLQGPDQSTVSFAQKPGSGTTWLPSGPDSDSLLTLTSGATDCQPGFRCFTLTDGDNVQTVLQTLIATSAVGTLDVPVTFGVSKVIEPGTPTATSFLTSGGLVTRIVSPVPAGATCTDPSNAATWTAQCRGLALTYGDGTAGKPWGQLVAATYLTSYLTSTGSSAPLQVDVACWGYDSNNRLRDSWDPRDIPTASDIPTGGAPAHVISCGGTPLRATHYDYDSAGRVSKITPAWNGTSSPLAGTTISYDATTNRLTRVDRAHLDASGTETSSVDYGVPVTPYDGHPEYRPDLSNPAAWGQSDLPVSGTVTCPPGAALATATPDLRSCAISYLDANSRVVNTASYSGTDATGWHLSTTEYDSAGRVIRTLDAANREEALSPTSGAGALLGLPADPVAAAAALSTISQYTLASDGTADLTDTFGPYHALVLSDGTSTRGRAHTHLTYDTGDTAKPFEASHPAGGSYHLLMTSTTGASLSVEAVPTAEVDQRSTRSDYEVGTDATGWTYRTPLQTVTDPGGLNIRRQTVLDAATGRVLRSLMPNDVASTTPGATAGTTVSVYYSKDPISGADSDCGSAPLWDGLLCKSYAGDLTAGGSGPGLVITKVNGYDYLGRAVSTTQTPSGDVGHARTTTTWYGFNSTVRDGVSSNPYANATTQTASSGGLGVALPAQTVSYDSGTGLSTGLSDGSTADASSYDDFGRLSSYTENSSASGAQGNVVTVVFDPTSGRVSSRRDQHQRITYAYNGGSEFRGLPTSVQVEVTASNNSTPAVWSGSFTAGYDSDGRPVTQTDPNGVLSTLSRDEAGQLVKRADTRGGAVWLTDEVSKSVFGQDLSHAGAAGAQRYAYDAAGRLTQVLDTPTTGNCTTRRYRFDANSNRLGLTSTVSADQTCGAGTAPTATISYDTADRILTAGTVYDSFGRTTTAPAATVTGGADLTVGYFANDLVASQTQGATTQTWTLDQGQQRLRTATTVVGGSTTKTLTNHYDDASSDSPVWIAETADGASWTANVTDLLGSLAATVDQAGTVTYQYANLHGDIQATCPAAAPAPTLSPTTDEYGNTLNGNPVPRYGWLGGKQRSGQDQGGLVLMGVRLYNPLSGRFLSTDPVPGGSANAYDYVYQDPINKTDLDGRCWPHWACKAAKAAAHAAAAAGSYAWDHRGTIATVVAGGACIAVTVGTCAALAGGAFLLRAQQRGMRHWRASLVDGAVTYATFGVAAAGEAGLEGLEGIGGLAKWGLKGALAVPGLVGDWSERLYSATHRGRGGRLEE
jgi:RHS repeat-associated protein